MPNDTRPPSDFRPAPLLGSERAAPAPSLSPFHAFAEYWTDAAQRMVLTLEALRQRGDNQIARSKRVAPHVLSFEAEVLVDGRKLARPVNYALVRIIPPADMPIDDNKRPFIVFDPRAGHGPGIGGMKQDSEIGEALKAGHPCYFVGFLPHAMPGQTIEDVCRAEAYFVQAVIARHPHAQSKPCLIGNCQAGWQIMMMAAMHPDLPGPILLAGAPLSYWAGVRGKNPMRYSGGILGGSWLTAMVGDLGHGTFDGAHLISNFEGLNPSNTYWTKPYNLYSKVDTEAARFLDFESWWGNPVTLNAGEMQFIVDELFVGNKLTSGQMVTQDGTRIDLRRIAQPIIVFCSWGDDITPPQQALGWLLDLYDTDAELTASGQTVVYTVHQTIGHLGIFVSGKIATKEHGKFTNCMDMIDMLPPGLFEAVITEVDEDTANPELIHGHYLFHLEPRGLDDIRALGGNTPQDQRRFETVARVSEINRGIYETTIAPAVRAVTSEASAELLRKTHPNRLRFELFSSKNPLLAMIPAQAQAAREKRQPVSANNPFLALERQFSSGITTMLNAYRDAHDTMTEAVFLATYGSPLLQALVGLGAPDSGRPRRAAKDLAQQAVAEHDAAQLERQLNKGGLHEAGLRGLLYILRAERRFDERTAAVLEAMLEAQPKGNGITRHQFRQMVREQAGILRLDEERAISALTHLLPGDAQARGKTLDAIRRAVTAQGILSEAGSARLDRLTALFTPLGVEGVEAPLTPSVAPTEAPTQVPAVVLEAPTPPVSRKSVPPPGRPRAPARKAGK